MNNTAWSAGRSALVLTGLGILSNLLAFCYRVALSRLAGAQVMGLYQLIMPVYSVLMSLTAIGFTAAVANLTARHLARRDRLAVHQTLQACLRGFLVCLLGAGSLLLLASDYLSTAFLGDARTRLGLVLLVPCVALTGIENLHKHVFYGAGLVGTPALVEVLEQLVRSAAVLGLLLAIPPRYPEQAVGLIVTGMVLCEVCSALALTLLYRVRLGRDRSGTGQPPEARRSAIGAIALPVAFHSLLGNLLSAANTALIPRLLTRGGLPREEAVARLGVLCGMTVPMLTLPTVFLGALQLVLSPRLARAWTLGRADISRRLMDRAVTLVSVLALPALSLTVVVGDDLGRALFHQDLGRHLPVLAAAMALSCLTSVLASCLNSTAHHADVAAVSLLGSGAQLALTALLTPGLGLDGYGAACLLSNLLELGLCLWAVHRRTGLTVAWFRWGLAPVLASALGAFCARLLFRVLKQAGLPPGPAGAAAVCLGLVLDGAALVAQGVDLAALFRLRSP